MFIDQVTPKGQDVNLESTYNFVFEVDTGRGEITAKLRNGTSQIDEALLSNVASIKDMTVKFSDNVLSPSPTDSVMYPQGDTSITSYVLSFDSSGRVIRSIDNSQAQTLKDLKLEMNIQNGNFARDIVISSPPSGNIVLEKRGGE
ncbi:MAG: hypothetical protein RR645_02395 [Clostridium sp.]